MSFFFAALATAENSLLFSDFDADLDRLNLRPSVSREECPEGGWASMLCQFESSREIAQRRNEHHTEWQKDTEVSGDSYINACFFFFLVNVTLEKILIVYNCCP